MVPFGRRRFRAPLPMPTAAAARSRAERVAFSVYRHPISRSDVPATPGFAWASPASALFESRAEDLSKHIRARDFGYSARENCARDYVFQIRRFAAPRLQFADFRSVSDTSRTEGSHRNCRRRQSTCRGLLSRSHDVPLEGARPWTATRNRIKIRGKYRSFVDADMRSLRRAGRGHRFYSQRDDRRQKLTSTGTGGTARHAHVNNPNRYGDGANPNFPENRILRMANGDAEAGLLDDAGKLMPSSTSHIQAWKRKAFPTGTSSCRAINYSGISSDTFRVCIPPRYSR